jgi:beta-lactamase class D
VGFAGSLAAAVAAAPVGAAEPPVDLAAAMARIYPGVDACVALRDQASGAEPSVSDPAVCSRRLPPCATFEIAATAIAIDRGLVPDGTTPLRRDPAAASDPPQGVTLKEAFRTPVPWVYQEIARRIGADPFGKAVGSLRYGNGEAGASAGPVDRMWLGETGGGLALSPVEQVDFLARLKRGELPVSAEAQSRTVEVIPFERIPDGLFAWKSGLCGADGGQGVAWTVGWVDRGPRSTIFAAAETGPTLLLNRDAAAERLRRLLGDMGLVPQKRP